MSHVTEENGFTKEQIERFELVLLFKQIALMLEKYYEPGEANNMIEAMIYSQDKIRYEGINRAPEGLLKEAKDYCKVCKINTYHHDLSYTKECVVCGSHKSL